MALTNLEGSDDVPPGPAATGVAGRDREGVQFVLYLSDVNCIVLRALTYFAALSSCSAFGQAPYSPDLACLSGRVTVFTTFTAVMIRHAAALRVLRDDYHHDPISSLMTTMCVDV